MNFSLKLQIFALCATFLRNAVVIFVSWNFVNAWYKRRITNSTLKHYIQERPRKSEGCFTAGHVIQFRGRHWLDSDMIKCMGSATFIILTCICGLC